MPFALCEDAAAQPRSFSIEGVVQFQNLEASNVATHWEIPFTIQVDGRRWRIDLPECERSPDYSYACLFDGKQTFCLVSFPRAIEKLRASGQPVADNVACGRISTLPLPRDISYPAASFLWLAYCSESELSRATNNQFIPVFGYGGGGRILDGKEVDPEEAHWQLATTSPHLPVAFTAVLQLPKPFLKEMQKTNPNTPMMFTNITFSVDSTTNTTGLAIPDRVHANLFRPIFGPAGPSLVMRAVALRVSSLVKTDLSKPPELPGPTAITDERPGYPGVFFANRVSWVTGLETKTTQAIRQVKKAIREIQKSGSN